MINLRLIY